MHTRIFLRRLLHRLSKVKAETIILLCVAHYFISYFLLKSANESDIIQTHIHYLYYWVVTSSTVGYGDISPTTDAGKLIVSLFFIPFSLILFGLVLSKIGRAASQHFQRKLVGMRDFNHLDDHILLLGYHQKRTHEIVDLILADKERNPRLILLVTEQEVEHPFLDVDGVEFCRVAEIADNKSMTRIAATRAAKIIVDGDGDDSSFVIASCYAKINPNAHITTHIGNSVIAANLQSQYENVEVIEDNTEEILVRSMQDNGSSRALSQLLKTSEGQTLYTAQLTPKNPLTLGELSQKLFAVRAIMVGIATNNVGDNLQINAPHDTPILEGETVYIHYISKCRVDIMGKL
jgi:voltage-gated potassium channel